VNDEPTARQNLGRMYTRWGRYEEALKYLTPEGEWWSALNYAFCMDALGRRQEALTVYRRLAEGDSDSPVTEWARLGLKEPTWPRDLDIPAEPGEVRIMPDARWQVTASRTVGLSRPELAIDNNRQTDWYTGNGQEPGQWFQLSFSCPAKLTRIVLDHHGERSIYTNNWPRGVEAIVTADGEAWSPVEVSAAGIMRPATVRFRPAQLVAAIKFTQTASHYPESWGIFEVFVFGPVT
jgi:tetratricopeptide (TPR) repeat protein